MTDSDLINRKLPVELLTHIFSCIPSEELRTFEIVCSYWKDVSRRISIRTIRLSRLRNTPALLHYLCQYPHLGRLVDALHVDYQESCFCCPHEADHTITLTADSKHKAQALSSILRLTPNLKSFTWHSLQPDMKPCLADTFCAPKKLCDLRLANGYDFALDYDLEELEDFSSLEAIAPLSSLLDLELFGFAISQAVSLPASVRSLTLDTCDLLLSFDNPEPTLPWNAPGLHHLSLKCTTSTTLHQLPERLAAVAPQIRQLLICDERCLQESAHSLDDLSIYQDEKRLHGFYSRFCSLTSLTISGEACKKSWLHPLPPVLEYLECINAEMWRDDLAGLIRDKEDRSPSLRSVIWYCHERVAVESDSRTDDALSRLCRDLDIQFTFQIEWDEC